MSEELEIFKKKLLYRASYRGTKEMDILLSSFVKSYIDKFSNSQLKELEKFLFYEDFEAYNFLPNFEKIKVENSNFFCCIIATLLVFNM